MRIVFAGTPPFAERALRALVEAGHDIPLVLTQPDRKAGRGMRPAASAVKQLATEHGLNVFQPARLSGGADLSALTEARADLLVVAAYGLILPLEVLEMAPRGALNIHASLLPRWRGAAPIQRAILAGDKATGISIMQMEQGLDTGPVIERGIVPISDEETAGSLHDKLAALGAEMIVRTVANAQHSSLRAEAQPADGVTYAHKVHKNDAALDWRLPSIELDRVVRAFDPAPGAHALLQETEIKVWKARRVDGLGAPGHVQSVGGEGMVVTCGVGALALTELQRPGGKRLPVRDFLRGHPVRPGACFSLPA